MSIPQDQKLRWSLDTVKAMLAADDSAGPFFAIALRAGSRRLIGMIWEFEATDRGQSRPLVALPWELYR
jgi:hypothetical protein